MHGRVNVAKVVFNVNARSRHNGAGHMLYWAQDGYCAGQQGNAG